MAGLPVSTFALSGDFLHLGRQTTPRSNGAMTHCFLAQALTSSAPTLLAFLTFQCHLDTDTGQATPLADLYSKSGCYFPLQPQLSPVPRPRPPPPHKGSSDT